MARVTVLMAVYNGEHFVRHAVESILAQTFRDFELLVVDDGSTDASRDVIRSYDDARIRVVENGTNRGLPQSLNRGLALARGEYVARHDADDVSEPDRLARQVAFLDANPDVALLGSWYRKIDERGEFSGDRKLPCDHTRLRWALLFYCPFVHSAVMIRSAPVQAEVGRYDEGVRYAEDHEFWIRIARRFTVANLAEFLVRYRVQPWSMTATHAEAASPARATLVRTVASMLGWDPLAAAENAVRFRAMFALLYGSLAELTPSAATAASAEIIRLHSSFSDELALGPSAAAAHRAELRARLRGRLCRLGARCARAGAPAAGLRLLAPVLRLTR